MKQFKENQILETRSICDHDCIFDGRVISRTEKTVKLDLGSDGIKNVKIFTEENGDEYCYPYGRYSFAPIFRA